MTQYNGLPDNSVYGDTIGTHDFANPDSWVSQDNSIWELKPKPGQAIEILGVQMDFSEDIFIPQSGQAILIKFWIDGQNEPIRTHVYENMSKWISRSKKKTRTEFINIGGAITGPTYQFDLDFALPLPVLWSSSGFDGIGFPKINRMTVEIDGNIPYKKNSVRNINAEMAVARYFVQVYSEEE
ncbi:MAG: hypothetical protein BV456_03095 [Thermoplasmata archaeon M8B2D]|nr:MAG: hypothetical protein BV456_03095 [Thermoplasmata archaeon M8B2D]